MKVTPENKVKQSVRELLAEYAVYEAKDSLYVTPAWKGWYFMPVPMGVGIAGIHDFIGHYKGKFFSIEAKAPGRRKEENRGCSAHQEAHRVAILTSGAASFVVDGEDDLRTVEAWLRSVDAHI